MEHPEPEIQGITVVLLGHFNPAILQPAWFEREKLLRDVEAQDPSELLVHPDFTRFRTGNWLTLECRRDRFLAESTDAAHASLLRDLVSGTFLLLDKTPLMKMGINRNEHYCMPSEDVERITNQLFERSAWGNLLSDPECVLHSAKVCTTSTEFDIRGDGTPPIRFRKHVLLTVERSVRFAPKSGLYIHVNGHYEVVRPAGQDSAEEPRPFMQILKEEWDARLSHGRDLILQILRLRGRS